MKDLILYADGASRGNPGNAGIGIIIYDNTEKVVKTVNKYIGKATNNVAEYNAFLTALEEAEKLGAKNIKIFIDSELVFKQYLGEYKINNESLKQILIRIREKVKSFLSVDVQHILREKNKEADKLANIAINTFESSLR
ncbi:MAG: hypothetical protein A2474_03035 [Elusimicrobia bacterium RIFOXYC2_FULL_34_12]|nr:MAG: hypothetical protein A2474_03035 [Elusimicrobia bacterium RIFOXYC2_FULL_34_12]